MNENGQQVPATVASLPLPTGRHVAMHIGIPTRGKISHATFGWTLSLAQSKDIMGIQHVQFWVVPYMTIEQARNTIVRLVSEFCAERPDLDHYVLWCDDDMVPKADTMENTFQKMYATLCTHPEVGLLSALVGPKVNNHPGFFPRLDDRRPMLPGRDYPPGALVEVEWCPTGFLMHRAEWLREIEKPAFFCDNQGAAGEDRWFSQQAKKLGLKCFIHSGCPVGHIDDEKHVIFTPHRASEPIVYLDGKTPEETFPKEQVFQTPMAEGEPLLGFLNCDAPMLARSMLKQLEGGPAPVVMLDNGSFTAQKLKDDGDPTDLVVIATPENKGWGGGVNEFMAQVIENVPACKAVWICNDDITGVSQAMGRRLYNALMATGAAIISPCCDNQVNGQIHNYHSNAIRRVTYVDMVAPMISVAAWKDVGPLDVDELGVGHGLDIDFCYRAKLKGWTFYVDDRSEIRHPSPSTTCLQAGTYEQHARNGWHERLLGKWDKSVAELIAADTVVHAKEEAQEA